MRDEDAGTGTQNELKFFSRVSSSVFPKAMPLSSGLEHLHFHTGLTKLHLPV